MGLSKKRTGTQRKKRHQVAAEENSAPYRKVRIEWADHCATATEGHVDTIDAEPYIWVSEGYVVHESEKVLVIAMSFGAEDPADLGTRETIIKSCIRRRRRL